MENLVHIIPHRPPFHFVDRVVEISENSIRTSKTFSPDEPFLAGHFPGNPIVPGVIICEAILQSAAVLLYHQIKNLQSEGTPVVTRMKNVAFKRMVRPDEEIEIQVELIERIKNFSNLRGTARVGGQLAVRLEFTGAQVTNE